MVLKPLIAALAALGFAASASAVQVIDFAEYTVTYDETTILGFNGGSYWGAGFSGFNWNIPGAVNAIGVASNAQQTFALPSFTIDAKPGYTVSNLSVFLGNLVFTHLGDVSSSVTFGASVSVDGGLPVVFEQDLDITTTVWSGGYSTGYHAIDLALHSGSYNSLSFDGASILLSANASGGQFASIVGQPQNQLKFEVNMAPVPEPETLAMMLAGLGALGWMRRRRAER